MGDVVKLVRLIGFSFPNLQRWSSYLMQPSGSLIDKESILSKGSLAVGAKGYSHLAM